VTCTPIPAKINTDVTCTATVRDIDPTGTKSAPSGSVSWTQDGSAATPGCASLVATGPDTSICTKTFTSSAPTVYLIAAAYSGSATHQGSTSEPVPIVFYDPTGGFVTGGGYILHGSSMTPSGGAGEKDNYGFVAKYKKGSNPPIPEGETEFKYKPGNLNFHSTSYDWLAVSGTRGQYQGSGTINGSGDYAFQVTVIDGGSSDRFRIKIWDKTTLAVTFDTEPGRPDTWTPTIPAAGGNIVVHKWGQEPS
jgi:hypothetical protein